MWREFAVGLLANIGTAETKEYLHALTTDPNKEVADYAKKHSPSVTSGSNSRRKNISLRLMTTALCRQSPSRLLPGLGDCFFRR